MQAKRQALPRKSADHPSASVGAAGEPTEALHKGDRVRWATCANVTGTVVKAWLNGTVTVLFEDEDHPFLHRLKVERLERLEGERVEQV